MLLFLSYSDAKGAPAFAASHYSEDAAQRDSLLNFSLSKEQKRLAGSPPKVARFTNLPSFRPAHKGISGHTCFPSGLRC